MSAELPMQWKVHTAKLLTEIVQNSGQGIYSIPLNIFGKLLAQVGERAAELNDPILNDLMCRLAIYTIADPDSKDYDRAKLSAISQQAELLRKYRAEVSA